MSGVSSWNFKFQAPEIPWNLLEFYFLTPVPTLNCTIISRRIQANIMEAFDNQLRLFSSSERDLI